MTEANCNLRAALEPLVSRARTDVTAIKASTGMSWTREPLTEARIKAHLNGGTARGVCPIKAGESTTRIALFDLDSHKGETSWEGMAAVATLLTGALRKHGMNPVPWSSSGGRGIHAYLVWDEPQDAFSVRQMCKAVLIEIGFKDGAKGVAQNEIEVFPKQDKVPEHGFGNQFILPLAGKSAPLEPLADFEVMPREYALQMLPWPVSAPVPVVQKPEKPIGAQTPALGGAALKPLAAALAAIPNDTDPLGYDEWLKVVAGIHHATQGSDEGYALAYEFSARCPKFKDENELQVNVWRWLDGSGETATPVTERTIYAMARDHGWKDEISLEEFTDLTLAEPREEDDWPPFKVDGKNRKEAVLGNVQMALLSRGFCGMDIRRDTFRGEIVYAPKDQPGQWMAFRDHHYTELRFILESKGFKSVGREMMRDVVLWVAEDQTVDSAQIWLEGLTWDGVSRVDGFYQTYFGVEASPYTTAVSRYIWTAMAGRVMVPGLKADMVPILTGEQGKRKSSGIEAMAPFDTFREMSFHQSEDARARLMRGCLLVELAELSGIKTRAIEEIKAWTARRKEDWVPKYQEYATTLLRRCVFQGTTNDQTFLDDPTGARRWLPLATGDVDVDGIARDRDQLWAEALVLFHLGGVAWQEAETLAKAEHGDYRVHDSWETKLETWLDLPRLDNTTPAGKGFTLSEALIEGVGFSAKDIKRMDETRCAKALRAIGVGNKRQRVGRRVVWRWSREGTVAL